MSDPMDKNKKNDEYETIHMDEIDKGMYPFETKKEPTIPVGKEDIKETVKKPPQNKDDFYFDDDFKLDGFTLEEEFIGRRDEKMPRKAPKKTANEMAPYVIATLIVGIVVVAVAFALAFRILKKDSPSVDESTLARTEEPSEKPTEEKKEIQTLESMFVMVQASENAQMITVFELEKQEEMILKLEDNTKINDKYGAKIALGEIEKGEILELDFNEEEKIVTKIRITPDAFNYNEVIGVEIVEEDNLILYGNDRFLYNEYLVTKKGDQSFNLTDLDPADTVTLRGYGEYVYQLSLVKGHGFIEFDKNEDIENGVVEIDYNIRHTLEELLEEKIPLPEGEHHIVIKGDNIKEYSQVVTVEQDETVTFSLEEIELTNGALHITTNIEDVQIQINGTLVKYDEPISLPFGEYKIEASKEGYTPLEETVTLDKAVLEVALELEKLISIANIHINSSPEGANVYLDNVYLGVTPVSTTAEFGEHVISLFKDGYEEASIPIDIDKEEYPINIEMHIAVPVVN